MTKHSGTIDQFPSTTGTSRPSLFGLGRPWRSLAALSLIGAAAVTFGLPAASPLSGVANVDVAHTVALTQVWSQTLNDAGGQIALSSPTLANLPGGPSVVVGDRSGHVYGLNLATGSEAPGWPVSTGGVPVDSTP